MILDNSEKQANKKLYLFWFNHQLIGLTESGCHFDIINGLMNYDVILISSELFYNN